MSPQRIQLRRTKGWRKPKGAVNVARPSKWGNPWEVGMIVVAEEGDPRAIVELDAATAVALYRRWIVEEHSPWWIRVALRGKDLACWCALDAPCHADVLLEIANPAPSPSSPAHDTGGE